jgi:hypothetical protein
MGARTISTGLEWERFGAAVGGADDQFRCAVEIFCYIVRLLGRGRRAMTLPA